LRRYTATDTVSRSGGPTAPAAPRRAQRRARIAAANPPARPPARRFLPQYDAPVGSGSSIADTAAWKALQEHVVDIEQT
jgi:hypothetical protein